MPKKNNTVYLDCPHCGKKIGAQGMKSHIIHMHKDKNPSEVKMPEPIKEEPITQPEQPKEEIKVPEPEPKPEPIKEVPKPEPKKEPVVVVPAGDKEPSKKAKSFLDDIFDCLDDII